MLLALFLFITLVLMLIGNFIGISSQYTFYHFGYNGIAIASRFIENTIFNIGWRVFLLGMTTMLAAAIMYFFYYQTKKGRIWALVVAYALYFADFFLAQSIYYTESVNGLKISAFMHLLVFSFVLFTLLLAFFRKPIRAGYYDHT